MEEEFQVKARALAALGFTGSHKWRPTFRSWGGQGRHTSIALETGVDKWCVCVSFLRAIGRKKGPRHWHWRAQRAQCRSAEREIKRPSSVKPSRPWNGASHCHHSLPGIHTSVMGVSLVWSTQASSCTEGTGEAWWLCCLGNWTGLDWTAGLHLCFCWDLCVTDQNTFENDGDWSVKMAGESCKGWR